MITLNKQRAVARTDAGVEDFEDFEDFKMLQFFFIVRIIVIFLI